MKEEYRVKWRGYSHRHDTWEEASSLAGCKGFKKFLYYVKTLDEADAWRQDEARTPEELEQADIARETAREELAEACKVERVVAMRQAAASVEYLVKWKEQAYADCTWEAATEVAPDASDEIASFEAREAAAIAIHSAAQRLPAATVRLAWCALA
jgi:chromodomain-helicase-DNA-binding protein 1